MQVQNATKPYDTINVTPMLDLAYVLLVVFILMTTASVQGLVMSLPKPSNKPSAERHDIKIIQISVEGALTVNGAGASMVELESILAAGRSRDPLMSVLIKGDARARYDMVMEVVDLCNRVQVNMGLVTSRIGT